MLRDVFKCQLIAYFNAYIIIKQRNNYKKLQCGFRRQWKNKGVTEYALWPLLLFLFHQKHLGPYPLLDRNQAL